MLAFVDAKAEDDVMMDAFSNAYLTEGAPRYIRSYRSSGCASDARQDGAMRKTRTGRRNQATKSGR